MTAWKRIPGFPDYEVSRCGEVRRGDRVMRPQLHRGYLRVQVRRNGKPKSLRIHRAVCEVFNGPAPSASHEVEHLDHDKTNNTASNLQWTSHAQNIQRSVVDGIHPKGESAGAAKLTEDQVREIRATSRYYGCVRDLAERFGVSKQSINHARAGLTWKHVK